ncbi:MAG: SMC-Scp complex subunit ScpB [Sphaerochaetaceae bacterium]
MHGLELLEQHGSYGFAPAADLHQRLRACYGKKVDRRLTKAALETLSIIACQFAADYPPRGGKY